MKEWKVWDNNTGIIIEEYEAQLGTAQEQNDQKIKDLQGKSIRHGDILTQGLFTWHVVYA